MCVCVYVYSMQFSNLGALGAGRRAGSSSGRHVAGHPDGVLGPGSDVAMLRFWGKTGQAMWKLIQNDFWDVLFFVCFLNGSRMITNLPQNGCFLPLLLNDLIGRHLALFDSLRKPKRCEDQSTGLPNAGLNLHSCYLISPGFLSGVSVPIINLELWMFEVSVSIRAINWMYPMIWSKKREAKMRSYPQRYICRSWVAGVCHHVLPWFATRTAGDDWSHLGVEWSSRGCDAGGCGGGILTQKTQFRWAYK